MTLFGAAFWRRMDDPDPVIGSPYTFGLLSLVWLV